MKLAAMEGLYNGQKSNGLVLAGIPQPGKKPGDGQKNFAVKIEVPGLLSMLGYHNFDAFVPVWMISLMATSNLNLKMFLLQKKKRHYL